MFRLFIALLITLTLGYFLSKYLRKFEWFLSDTDKSLAKKAAFIGSFIFIDDYKESDTGGYRLND